MDKSINDRDDTFEISVEFTEYCRANRLSNFQFWSYLQAIAWFVKNEGSVPDTSFSIRGWEKESPIGERGFVGLLLKGLMVKRETPLPDGSASFMPAGYGEVWR
jgi:hypothetical protein